MRAFDLLLFGADYCFSSGFNDYGGLALGAIDVDGVVQPIAQPMLMWEYYSFSRSPP